MANRIGPGVKAGVGRTYEQNEEIDRAGQGCVTYILTGRVGHCVMLPMWRWIGARISSFWN